MISIFFTVLVTLTSLVFAEDPSEHTNHLSSTQASYDGSALVLEGRVKLDHGLGNMCADQAYLQRQEAGKDFPFSLIELKNHVLLSLKNTAKVNSPFAMLDFTALKGTLGKEGEEKVKYVDALKREGKLQTPITLVSQFIDLDFVKSQDTKSHLQYDIHSLLAKIGVEIEYASDFLLRSDEASYSETGILQAYATQDSSRCSLLYQGETLEADRIYANTLESKMQIQRPAGTLPSGLFSSSQKAPLYFECEQLLWDHKSLFLKLQNHVTLQEPTLGSLYAKNDVEIEQFISQNTTQVKAIYIRGESLLEREEPEKQWKHSLSCPGLLHVDGIKNLITLTSSDQNQKPVVYKDNEVLLSATKAVVEYENATSYQPLSLSLQGNVTLESNEPGAPLRQAIADRLIYSPETQTIILSALSKRRVLFKDDQENLSMSAREIHLTKDPATGKMQAKGIGQVKLSLTGEESQLFQQLFSKVKGL